MNGGDEIVIRPATPADAARMQPIEDELFGPESWSREQIDHELARLSVDRWYAVAERGAEVLGYVGIFLSPPDADVQTVAVSGLAQGTGVGRQLLAASIAEAWERGCNRIFLEVRSDNSAALRLYEAAGFTRLGVRRQYYADGTDAVNMRLRRHEPVPLSEVSDG